MTQRIMRHAALRYFIYFIHLRIL